MALVVLARVEQMAAWVARVGASPVLLRGSLPVRGALVDARAMAALEVTARAVQEDHPLASIATSPMFRSTPRARSRSGRAGSVARALARKGCEG